MLSNSYPNWVVSLFSAVGFVLCCIPFPWHLQAWNAGTCLVMAWLGLICLGLCINSIIWKGNSVDWAPVWCDIFTRLFYGINIGIPAASLCINRRLYLIASMRKVTISRADKRNQIVVDLAIGLGIPIIFIILQYINQDLRFVIYEDFGCIYATYQTWILIVLLPVPCILIGLVSCTYAILSICAIRRVHEQSKKILSVHASLTNSRYIRLLAFAATDATISISMNVFAMVADIRQGLLPWTNWEDVHDNISRVYQVPAKVWRSYPTVVTVLEIDRWICIGSAFIFFAYFGFSDEATKRYCSAIRSVGKCVGVSTERFGSSFISSGMSKNDVGLRPGSIPEFSSEKFTRKDSSVFNTKGFGSLTTSSIPTPKQKKWSFLTSILSPKKKSNEEVSEHSFQYNDVVLPDVGRTLRGSFSDNISTIPVSVSLSAAPSISAPESAIIHPEVVDVPTSVSTDSLRYSHNIV